MLRQLSDQHEGYLPDGLPLLENAQRALPAIAKNAGLIAEIENAVRRVPTQHEIVVVDARQMQLDDESLHLVLTSPPYWTLKNYRDSPAQLGHFEDTKAFSSKSTLFGSVATARLCLEGV